MLIPIGIESLFDCARYSCLFRVDRDNCEWVREAEEITFDQAICRNDWKKVSVKLDHLNGLNEDDRPVILIFLLCKRLHQQGTLHIGYREKTDDPPKFTVMTSEEGRCNGQKKKKKNEAELACAGHAVAVP